MGLLGNLFSVLFGGSSKDKSEMSEYMPDRNLPVDEQFILNFKQNGGKFLYCENIDEVKEYFVSILQENDWFEKEALTHEELLESFLSENKLYYQNPEKPSFLLCTCEGLVAHDGAILFSSKQLSHKKSCELPKNFIVFTTTKSIIETKSDGLRNIQEKYQNDIPTNITTFDCFKEEKAGDDFLQYGKESKNMYLLLLEDL